MNESNPSQADKLRAKQGADADAIETSLWEGSFSGKSMFGSWLLAATITLLVVAAVMLIEVMQTNGTVWVAAIVLIAVMWIGLAITLCYRKWSRNYHLTTQRIKHRDGIIFRKMDRIELIDIDDVTYHQGPIQALLNVGNIQVKSSDASHPQLTMFGIANVREVADQIDDARRAERRKRGLHIEAI